jgi:hypothetical protein
MLRSSSSLFARSDFGFRRPRRAILLHLRLHRADPPYDRDPRLRTIDAAEGRIIVGSSTEVHDAVPLENFLAMREAVLEYR